MIILIIYITIVAILFLQRIFFARRHFLLKTKKRRYLKLEETPTVTICVPVRNESHVIAHSLELILATDYPKLEILVLDDDSVDNTSDIIKGFAHDGVRFIKGSALGEGWIGKNKALAELSERANGEYLIFLSIDTKIRPETIADLINYALEHDCEMLSVMPRRKDNRFSQIFGTMRFFWEIVLHSVNKPAISTSCWLVKREALANYQNFFQLHKATTRPEDSLARYFSEQDKYRFLIANDNLDISYAKKWSSQVATSIRTLVPLFEKNTWLMPNIVLILIIAPIGWVVLGLSCLFSPTWLNIALLISLLLFNFSYAIFCKMAWQKQWLWSLFLTPFVFGQELILLILSYIHYQRDTVTWKGRKLPEVED